MKIKILYTHLFIFIFASNAFSSLHKIHASLNNLNTSINSDFIYNIELSYLKETPIILSKFSTNNYSNKIIFTTIFLHNIEIMNGVDRQSNSNIITTLPIQYNFQKNNVLAFKPIKNNFNKSTLISSNPEILMPLSKFYFLKYSDDATMPPKTIFNNQISANSKYADLLKQGKHLTWYGIGSLTLGVIATFLLYQYNVPDLFYPAFIPPPFVTGISLIAVGQALIHKAKKIKNH